MPTINSKQLVDEIIARNGHYEDDPQVVKIVEYTNDWGGRSYGLIYEQHDPNMYAPSPFVHNPKTIWERNRLRSLLQTWAIELLTPDEVVVLPIRISQVLYTTWTIVKGRKFVRSIATLPRDNPWVQWCTYSRDNYEYLWNYGMDILDRHDELFGNANKHPYHHGSKGLMAELENLPPLPTVGLTAFPKATV